MTARVNIPGFGRIPGMNGVTKSLHDVGLVWIGGGFWSSYLGNIGNHCTYVRVRDGMEVAGVAVQKHDETRYRVTPQWRREAPPGTALICRLKDVASCATEIADLVESFGKREPVKYVPEEEP